MWLRCLGHFGTSKRTRILWIEKKVSLQDQTPAFQQGFLTVCSHGNTPEASHFLFPQRRRLVIQSQVPDVKSLAKEAELGGAFGHALQL